MHLLIKYLLQEHSSSYTSQSQVWLQALSHTKSSNSNDLSQSAKSQSTMRTCKEMLGCATLDRVRSTAKIRSSSVGWRWENGRGMSASAESYSYGAVGDVTWSDGVQQGCGMAGLCNKSSECFVPVSHVGITGKSFLLFTKFWIHWWKNSNAGHHFDR